MVVEMMEKKEHLTLEGLSKIISIRASMNKGLTDILKSNFPNITPVERPVIYLPNTLDPYWVLGFCNGEANFDKSINKNNTYSFGYQVQLRFRVSQHSGIYDAEFLISHGPSVRKGNWDNRDLLLLTKLIEFFNCGQIEKYKIRPAVNYVVTSFTNINTNIISFFEKYTLLGIKALDFQDFNKAANLISSGDHKTNSGLEKIRSIKAGINSNRTF